MWSCPIKQHPKFLCEKTHILAGCPGSFWVPPDPSKVTNCCITSSTMCITIVQKRRIVFLRLLRLFFKFCIEPSVLVIFSTLKAKKHFQHMEINALVSWVKIDDWSDTFTYYSSSEGSLGCGLHWPLGIFFGCYRSQTQRKRCLVRVNLPHSERPQNTRGRG